MRKILILIGFVFMTSPALSHPPRTIRMSFNHNNSIMKIEVEHEVGNIGTHYVEELNVSLNGEEIILQNFSIQEDSSTQKAIYYLHSVSVDDEITISAECSRFGTKTDSFKIVEPKEKKENNKEKDKDEKE